jgi:NTP pyrophosphatase (non-canonical NTP hydrolase)
MKFKEYIGDTGKTWNHQENNQTNLEHALIGLLDETGELASAIKKKVGYGKDIDLVNVKEEIGDATYFLARTMVCLYNEDQIEELSGHLDNIMDEELNEKGQDAMSQYQYTDVVYGLSLSFNSIYSSMVEGKHAETAQAIANSFASLKTTALYFDLDIEDCMVTNIAKLKKRFPYNFSQEKALNRDLKVEREELEKDGE